jgi:hypothetical protein
VAIVAVLALGALAVAGVLLSGRTRPVQERLDAARQAVVAAHRSAAREWAKDALAAADAAFREGLEAHARQEAHLVLARDFRTPADLLRRAETAAWAAAREGRERREEARAVAERAINVAQEDLGHALKFVRSVRLQPAERVSLQRARLLASEARFLVEEGAYREATERAERSRQEIRAAVGPALAAALRYAEARSIRRWRGWIGQTRAWSRAAGATAIVVSKEGNELILYENGNPVRRYPADLGSNGLGFKLQAGDRATPEGHYRIVARADQGGSRYYKALVLDYPNEADRRRLAEAKSRGLVSKDARLGGHIEIHGEGGRGSNWTEGCVALSNADMDDLMLRVGVGTRVTIVGSDGKGGAFSGVLAHFARGGGARKP